MVTINFDKLELSLKQTCETDCLLEYYEEGREMIKGGFLLYNPRPLSDYKCVWEVFDQRKQIKIGLFFAGFKRFANADYCRFKFDDALFYADKFDFEAETVRFCNVFSLELTGISSLDIAFDTDENCIFSGYAYTAGEIKHRAKGSQYEDQGISLAQFVEAASHHAIIRESKFNRCKIKPIAEFSGWCGKYDTLYLGERGSSVFCRIYNKSLEMEKKGEKTFITDEWRRRGYDGKNAVWRFEISLNHLSAKRNRLMLEIAENDGFLLVRDALPKVKKELAPAFFFASQEEFFTFSTVGGNSKRKTKFYNKLSYNCGYVLSLKRVKQTKTRKDIIRYNTITRFFSKYTRGIFRTPEAREFFTINQRINANAFCMMYEELHARYLAAKGAPAFEENEEFFLKKPPLAAGCPHSIT